MIIIEVARQPFGKWAIFKKCQKGIMIKNGIRSIMGENRKCCVFEQIVSVG